MQLKLDRLTLDDIEREACEGGFLIAGLHIEASKVHCADDLIERDLVFFRLLHGNASGVDGFDGAHGVALDAGNLNESANRVAGHAEVMFHGDFRGVLDLSGRAAERGGKTASGHRAGYADFSLAADLRAADGGIFLI